MAVDGGGETKRASEFASTIPPKARERDESRF